MKKAFVVKFAGAGYYAGIHTSGNVVTDGTKETAASHFRTPEAAEACMKRHADCKGMKKYSIEEVSVADDVTIFG